LPPVVSEVLVHGRRLRGVVDQLSKAPFSMGCTGMTTGTVGVADSVVLLVVLVVLASSVAVAVVAIVGSAASVYVMVSGTDRVAVAVDAVDDVIDKKQLQALRMRNEAEEYWARMFAAGSAEGSPRLTNRVKAGAMLNFEFASGLGIFERRYGWETHFVVVAAASRDRYDEQKASPTSGT
jgi:hypothetical protein